MFKVNTVTYSGYTEASYPFVCDLGQVTELWSAGTLTVPILIGLL